MKKFFILSILALSLASCGSNTSTDASADATADSTAVATPDATVADSTACCKDSVKIK